MHFCIEHTSKFPFQKEYTNTTQVLQSAF